MYRVEWNDFEGNLQGMNFQTPEEAKLEAEALKEKFDFVEWGLVEHLYSVSVEDKETGERFSLKVWAETTDAATHKLTKALFGADGPYLWKGSGPIYRNNQLITRITPA